MLAASTVPNTVLPESAKSRSFMMLVTGSPPVVEPPAPIPKESGQLSVQSPTEVVPRRLDDVIPRRSPALFLDRADCDVLVDQLMRELGPLNQLAAQTIHTLAQEMAKLQFLQRVEFALLDRAQAVEDREWQDLEYLRTGNAHGKSSEQCRRELLGLRALQKEIYNNRDAPLRVPSHDVDWLSTIIWNRISFWDRKMEELNREIDDIDSQAPTADEDTKEWLEKERQKAENDLREAKAEDQKSGRLVHGIQTLTDVREILGEVRLIPNGTRATWEDTVALEISMVGQAKEGALNYEKRLSAMQTRAAQQAVQAVDTLGPIRQHSATVWKNVDRCLKRLEMFGVNLKGAKTKLFPLTQEGDHETR